jgi:hypothetical protein
LICFSIFSCLVFFHNSSFVIICGQCMLHIFHKHLFIKVCNLLTIVCVIFHVSHPYRSTTLTLVSNILNLVL